MSDPLLQQRELVQHLLASTDAADTALIETHVSWLLLIGGFAYKIKKALDLGFWIIQTCIGGDFSVKKRCG